MNSSEFPKILFGSPIFQIENYFNHAQIFRTITKLKLSVSVNTISWKKNYHLGIHTTGIIIGCYWFVYSFIYKSIKNTHTETHTLAEHFVLCATIRDALVI